MKKFLALALALVMGLGLTSCGLAPSGEGKATYQFSLPHTVNAQTLTKAAIQTAFIGNLAAINNASAVGLDAVELTGDYATNDDLAEAACAEAEKTCNKFDYDSGDSYQVLIKVTYETGKTRNFYKHTFKAK